MGSHNANIKNSVLSSLAVERKKVVLAGLLIVVMVFMWTRALNKKKPASVDIDPTSDAVMVQEKEAQISVEYVPVSIVIGHEEFSGKDFFDISNLIEEGTSAGNSCAVVVADSEVSQNNIESCSGEEKLDEVVRKLSLRAVVSGPKSMALINDSIYRLGDQFSVNTGNACYSLKIIGINQNQVKLECLGKEVQLTLTGP